MYDVLLAPSTHVEKLDINITNDDDPNHFIVMDSETGNHVSYYIKDQEITAALAAGKIPEDG